MRAIIALAAQPDEEDGEEQDDNIEGHGGMQNDDGYRGHDHLYWRSGARRNASPIGGPTTTA
jgi:hypothetical protein